MGEMLSTSLNLNSMELSHKKKNKFKKDNMIKRMQYFLSCILLITCVVRAQLLGPSLWNWGFQNVTTYTVFPNVPATDPIFKPHGVNELPSACNGNPTDPWSVGFACPHLLLFSSDLLLAAERDGLGEIFFYGTAATQSDNDCGKCFQVKIGNPQSESNDTYFSNRQLILQVTNSGFDVVPGQFDVHMGAGGLGYYTACNQDCRSRFCQGGPCAVGMFNSMFSDWTPDGNCYGGGLRMLSTDYDKVWELCARLIRGNDYKDDVLRQVCWYANIMFYHQNFFSTDSLQVQCPESLTKATGLKRTDEATLPTPHPMNTPTIFCRNKNCITGYHDCCKMSCSWKFKGSPDPVLSRVYTCDFNGFPI